jgi:hypothetical protein
MSNVTSTQPWELRELNQSGIRRLKLVDARLLLALPFLGLVPQQDLVFYEFIFPSDLSCAATVQRVERETGSVFWNSSIAFNLPHISDELVTWAAENGDVLWIIITEDYNGFFRFFGGLQEGMRMSFQATTGGGPTAQNPMAFNFSAEQLLPYKSIPAYEDNILFQNTAGFSYGFSLAFNS